MDKESVDYMPRECSYPLTKQKHKKEEETNFAIYGNRDGTGSDYVKMKVVTISYRAW